MGGDLPKGHSDGGCAGIALVEGDRPPLARPRLVRRLSAGAANQASTARTGIMGAAMAIRTGVPDWEAVRAAR